MVPVSGGRARVPVPGTRTTVPGTGTGTPRSTQEVPGTLPKYPVLSTVQSGTGTPKKAKYLDFGYFGGTSGP